MMTSENLRPNQRATTAVLATVTFLSVACASAPRNPVLDKYPVGVSGRTSVFYYDVHGHTFDELRADMRRLGPKVDGRTFVGETRSPMQWSWRTQAIGSGSCRIRDVSVSVNAQITLPRWTPPPDTEPGLLTEWKRFLTALEVHEAGHKDISAKAGSAIVERLRGLSELCSHISFRANDIARTIVDRASKEQAAYDATTRHGLTQGTSFGPARFGGATILDPSSPMTLLVGPRPGTVRGALPVSVDSAWTAMPAAYAAINLAINVVDSIGHVVGDSIIARGTVGTIPVSELLDCGLAPTGQNADSVDVVLFVTSRLEPGQPSGSTVVNTVQAVARPSGAPPIACRSRGVLERSLFQALRNQLTR